MLKHVGPVEVPVDESSQALSAVAFGLIEHSVVGGREIADFGDESS